ncbi:MAG: alpha/beta fold hydrolase [Enterovibrio sp.]
MILHYTATGDGPALLLLHGLFGAKENLNLLAKKLSAHFLVYQVDLPNHGLSPQTKDMSYNALAQHLANFIKEELKLDKLHLVGHSMGAKAAMMLALQSPNLIEKVVALDMAPAIYHTHHHSAIFAALEDVQRARITSRAQADAHFAKHHVAPSIRQFLLKSLYQQPDGTYDWRFNLNNLSRCYPQILDWQPAPNSQFTGPTLFIKGADSDYLQSAHQSAILRQFPHAKAHIIANTSHWLHAEQPQKVYEIIRQFL